MGIGLSGDWTGANLAGQNLRYASFYWAKLTGVNLTGADVRGASFTRDDSYATGLTPEQLYSTASYQAHDLTGVGLAGNNLAGLNLAGQNLTNANFADATLTGTDFTGAIVRGANLSRTYGGSGITFAQLYSTASYQAHDLTGIRLDGNNLAGVNLAGQNLTSADFSSFHSWNINNIGANLAGANLSQANLTNANFAGYYVDSEVSIVGANLTAANLSGADARGATFELATLTGANLSHANLTNVNFDTATLTGANLSSADARGAYRVFSSFSSAITANLIRENGHIHGLDLNAGQLLVVRDYDGNLPIRVDQHLAMDTTGTLRMIFDADPWGSTMFFAPGIPVARGGRLDLSFLPDVNLAGQIGRTIDLFDWAGVTPTGTFNVSTVAGYTWDLSKLYTTGEVTLTAALGVVPGDFNGDGSVDAADYIVWRKQGGTSTQYATWRANFGQPAGNGSGPNANATAPEPAASIMLMFSAAGWCVLRRPAA
jgi:uncharacterized protein YjbI with pentapeptide repeats